MKRLRPNRLHGRGYMNLGQIRTTIKRIGLNHDDRWRNVHHCDDRRAELKCCRLDGFDAQFYGDAVGIFWYLLVVPSFVGEALDCWLAVSVAATTGVSHC